MVLNTIPGQSLLDLGDVFIPKNEAELELSDEIADASEGAIIDSPYADW